MYFVSYVYIFQSSLFTAYFKFTVKNLCTYFDHVTNIYENKKVKCFQTIPVSVDYEYIDALQENSGTVNCNLSPSNKGPGCFVELKTVPLKIPKNLIVGHLNVNSVGNKFDYLN